ncbi:hypothetical protein OHR68_06705 [Spirillospora sp. NBC_00431]
MEEFTFSGPLAAEAPLVQQWAPIAGAALVFAGAMVTLLFTLKREDRRNRQQREDDHKKDQRVAIAEIAVAAHEYRKKRMSADAPQAMLNKLTIARLIIYDPALQKDLDELFQSWQALENNPASPGPAWERFNAGEKALQDNALKLLKPSVFNS